MPEVVQGSAVSYWRKVMIDKQQIYPSQINLLLILVELVDITLYRKGNLGRQGR